MNVDEAVMFLKEIARDIGTMGMEYRGQKDSDKAMECINFLAKRIEELTEALENV